MEDRTLRFVWNFRHEPRYTTIAALKQRFEDMCRREEDLAEALHYTDTTHYKKPNKMAQQARHEKPMFEVE